MGLFDSRKVKNEKRIYSELYSLNLCYMSLDEFLKPNSDYLRDMKEKILETYNLTISITDEEADRINFNRADLKDFVSCYNFIYGCLDTYNYFKEQENVGIVDFLKSYDSYLNKWADSIINEHKRRNDEIYNSPGMKAMDARAREEGQRILKEMGFDDNMSDRGSGGRGRR